MQAQPHSDATNPILLRAIRHMRWANQRLLIQLSELPEEVLAYSAWNPEWTVGIIANHITIGAGRLASRILNEPAPFELPDPKSKSDLLALIKLADERDLVFERLLDTPDEPRKFVRYGEEVEYLTSTILAQVAHHASEHRTQISDIMAANGKDVIDLDEMDLWSFELWERKSRN